MRPLLAAVAALLAACSSSGATGPSSSSDAGSNDGASSSGDAAICLHSFHATCLERVIGRDQAANELAYDGGYLYFSVGNGYSIRRMAIATKAVEPVASFADMLAEMVVEDGYVYFATVPTSGMSNAGIERVPVTGGTVETLVSGLSSNAHIDVDGGYVYFTVYGASLDRVPIGGGMRETLTPSSYPGWVAARAGNLYWAEQVWSSATSSWSGVLSHALVDFSFAENLETSGVSRPLALGPSHVYWYDFVGGAIRRTPLVKGATEALGAVTPDNVTRSAELVLSDAYVYVLTNQDELVRVPLAGGTVEPILAASWFLDLVAAPNGAYVNLPNDGVYFVPDAL